MFSKHVWYDRQHQAEVFINDDGVVSGTIVAYEGTVFVINPRPEILMALYQEAKLKRILSLRGVVMTDNAMEYARGLCALVNYSRGLRRRSPLVVVARQECEVATEFLSKCCSHLLGDALFELSFERIATGERFELGRGSVGFVEQSGLLSTRPLLSVETQKGKVLHYFDEGHEVATTVSNADIHPDLVIRAGEMPQRLHTPRVGIMSVG